MLVFAEGNAVILPNGTMEHQIFLLLEDFVTFTKVNPSKINALANWMEDFWLPTQRRKNPSFDMDIIDLEKLRIRSTACAPVQRDFWEKQVSNGIKKVDAEDLGFMDAIELLKTIPDSDSEGRGKKDLAQMQKELHVTVHFAQDGHLYLVGQKQKLAKKCFTLRNVLSHYHWRLSGKDAGR
jgi:hypothetical protein